MPIPQGWRSVTLNDLQSADPRAITDGPFGSNLTSADYTDMGPRVIRLQNIGDGRFIDSPAHISAEHFEKLRKHEAKAGDLVLASLGEGLPRACLVPDSLGPAIVKADCIRIRLGESVEPRWVLYAMQTPAARSWAKDQLHGVGRPRLGLKVIRAIPVPLPPRSEQRRILYILEDHLSRLDAAADNLDRVAESLLALRLASLRDERKRVMDAGASLATIGELAQTSLGKMLDAKKASGSPTPYLRNINVRWGFVDVRKVLTVPLSDQERERLALQSGDLLVCEGGEPGRCAVWRHRGVDLMTYQKALHRIRVGSCVIDVDFLALMLEEFIRTGRGEAMFTGTTIKHLPQERLRTIPIPVPAREVQLMVVARTEVLAAESDRLRNEVRTARSRSDVLRRGLLQAAFAGRLTGSSTDTEIIEELAGV